MIPRGGNNKACVEQTDGVVDAIDCANKEPICPWAPKLEYAGEKNCCGTPPFVDAAVDCTKHGDDNAYCVFGHHCACGVGFKCSGSKNFSAECNPGDVCVSENEL